MRIGLTLYGSLDERSGGFHYDRELVRELRERGDTVEVIELPWRAYGRGLLDNLSGRLRDRLDVDVDAMLQDELAHPSLVGTNRHLSYPVVSIVHHLRASEPGRLAPLYRTIERRYLQTVDGIVCNSAATESVVTGLVDAPTVVAPPAGDRFAPDVDEGFIDERATREPLQVVFLGNVTPRKGLDTLVDGLAAAEGNIELTVIGRPVDGDHVAAVRRRIREHGLGDRVELTGELPDDAVADRLRAAHVLAVPSRYEGFGIVYLEGMGFGLPAVASAAGGAGEVVTDGETGVLVDPDDAAAVGRALTAFAGDRDRLARMGNRARRRYERHPGWAETADRVRELLADVAGVDELEQEEMRA
jgi:glycosyltransferase involved in cell wall biosynthesis